MAAPLKNHLKMFQTEIFEIFNFLQNFPSFEVSGFKYFGSVNYKQPHRYAEAVVRRCFVKKMF